MGSYGNLIYTHSCLQAYSSFEIAQDFGEPSLRSAVNVMVSFFPFSVLLDSGSMYALKTFVRTSHQKSLKFTAVVIDY